MTAAAALDDAPALARGQALVIVGDGSPLHRRARRVLDAGGLDFDGLPWPLPATGSDAPQPGATAVLAVAGEPSSRIEAIRSLAGTEAVVALLPDATPRTLLKRALQLGASGIVGDAALESALVPTIEAVRAGQIALPSGLGSVIAPAALSHRERQVLGLVASGLTNRQIAARLFLAESTVKSHLLRAFAKIGASSRAEAAEIVLDPDAGYGHRILLAAHANGMVTP